MTSFDFDDQAASFDRRAGLPAEVARGVARVVAEIVDPAAEGTLVELGAGTGEIGVHLAAVLGSYVGVDVSYPMLGVFRGRRAGTRIVRADADRPWPIRDRQAKALFLSRAAHLLEPGHLVEECLRVRRPEGGVLILGGVRRDPESLRAVLRREMHRLLAEHDIEGRSGPRGRRRLIELFEERGAWTLPRRNAGTWQVTERVADSLAAWRSKSGLAGRAVPPDVRRDVLGRLERWARERYGDLEKEHLASETYEVTALIFPT